METVDAKETSRSEDKKSSISCCRAERSLRLWKGAEGGTRKLDDDLRVKKDISYANLGLRLILCFL